MGNTRKSKFDEAAQEIFFHHLAETGRIMEASKLAGMAPMYGSTRKAKDDEFRAQVEEALAAYRQNMREKLEAEAIRRGIEGVVEKKYHQGQPVIEYEIDEHGEIKRDDQGRPIALGQATVRKYSDNLLLTTLRRYAPEYNEKKELDIHVSPITALLEELDSDNQELPSDDRG